MTNYAYDPLNRLKQVSGLISDAYIYDNSGNRLTDGKYRYTYDAVNRLIKKEGAERLTQAKGAMPISILKGTYSSGQEILLKQGPPQSGNFGCLALGGRGANTYRDNLKYGYNVTLKIGDMAETEPGNMAGPTREGIEYRIAQKQTKIIVPVLASWDVSGRKQIRIEGFETVEIIGMEGDAIRAKVIGSAEETLYTYDNNGNLIGTEDSKGKTVLEYDYENRLTKLTKPDGTWTRFTYDPFGRRYSKETSDGQKEIYIYDGLHIVEVYDGNTMQPKSSFVHSDIIDEVLFGNIQGQDVYYHQDGLNSVKALTDGGGNEMARYDYDAWGNLTTTLPSIANPFTYTGREWDRETGLYYYRARYYDAKVGRFVSKDPIGLAGGINLYSYVGNNPVNWIDPLGLHWLPTQHPAGLIPHTHAGANGPVTVVNPRDPGAWPGDPQHIKPSNCEKGCGAEFALCIGRVYAQRRNEARACLTLCGIAAATKNPGSIVACGICIGGGTLYIWDCYQKSCN